MIRPSSHTSCDTSVYTLDLYQSLCEHSFFKVQLPFIKPTITSFRWCWSFWPCSGPYIGCDNGTVLSTNSKRSKG